MSIELYNRDGSPYWYARITVGGKTRRVSTRVPRSRATKTQAIEAAEVFEIEFERELQSGQSVTLRQTLTAFLTDRQWDSPATLRAYTGFVADLYDHVDTEKTFLTEVDPTWVRQHFAAFRAKFSRNKVRMLRTVLSGAIDNAIVSGVLGAPTVNPLRVVERLVPRKPKHSMKRYLSLSQVDTLLLGVQGDPFWEPFLSLFLETGMRHQELLQLQWGEVDLDKGVVVLADTREKTARGRLIPLSDHALNTLKRIPIHPVFSEVWISRRTRKPLRDIEMRWRALRDKLGFPGLRIHDLRHTFATITRASGMSREDRMKIVGHSSTETHAVYADVEVETLRRTLNQHSVCTLLTHKRESVRSSKNSSC